MTEGTSFSGLMTKIPFFRGLNSFNVKTRVSHLQSNIKDKSEAWGNKAGKQHRDLSKFKIFYLF